MNNKFGEDSLTLIRSMFENYLEIIGITNSSGELLDSIKANIDYHTGKFTTDPKDFRYLIEVESNKRVKKDISVKSLAKNSPFPEDIVIYEYLYSWLSQFVHPDIFSVSSYTGKNGFDYLKSNYAFEAVLFSSFINSLILHKAVELPAIDNLSRSDIKMYLKQIIPILLSIFDEIRKETPGFPNEFSLRILRIKDSV